MTEIAESVGPYEAGERWAEPSVDHAAGLLRWVFENRARAGARGQIARHEILVRYSEPGVAELISARLGAIATRQRLTQFQEDARERYASYRELASRIRRPSVHAACGRHRARHQ